MNESTVRVIVYPRYFRVIRPGKGETVIDLRKVSLIDAVPYESLTKLTLVVDGVRTDVNVNNLHEANEILNQWTENHGSDW